MQKIIIVGGGFAGLTAACCLGRAGARFEVCLIDKKNTADFLPMLPDLLGRGITPGYLRFNLEKSAKASRFSFIKQEVSSIDMAKKEVSCVNLAQPLKYDYLIVASGSETNFYGNNLVAQNSFKLDNVEDGSRLLQRLREKSADAYIIAGGGYTGIEVATNLRIFLNKVKRHSEIVIVERAPAILGVLPEWMRQYVGKNLNNLNIQVLTNSSIEKIEGDTVAISGGRVFSNSLLIWCAGVKIADFAAALGAEKNPQGRVKVDKYMRINESCFFIGDAANFVSGSSFLRMAVQFAIAQGRCAARNIVNSSKGRPLVEYRPFDFGYIIPMANNKSCGIVLGVNLKGFLPTALHYIMCIYRSYGLKNKWGIFTDLLRGGGR